MTLYCIAPPGDSVDLLREAAGKRGITCEAIHPVQFNFLAQPHLGPGDMLYRAVPVAQFPTARAIEQLLLNEHVATFYRSFQTALDIVDSHMSHVRHRQDQLPTPRRIWPLTRERQQLRDYVTSLGGLPVVLKVIGGNRGLGIMKITSLASLFSIVDYLVLGGVQVIMQEYIDVGEPAHSQRAIVIGDKVVAAYTLVQSEADEFRSNVGMERKGRIQLSLTPHEEGLMVRAVHSLGVDLGAVDFVRRAGQKDNIAIFEVNCPFNFVPAVRVLQEPVAQHMVDYLMVKAQILAAMPQVGKVAEPLAV